MRKLTMEQYQYIFNSLPAPLAAVLQAGATGGNRASDVVLVEDSAWQQVYGNLPFIQQRLWDLAEQHYQITEQQHALINLRTIGIENEGDVISVYRKMLDDHTMRMREEEQVFQQRIIEFFEIVERVFPKITKERLDNLKAFL